ncbi:MAG TPA: inorganic triphosphatase, partial [Accumulibacter sp.]|nr:inorganic triphosphatase [Accumulibacter sp.]
QELLGQLNDLAVAAQLVAEGLPAKQGQVVQDWLQQRSALLMPGMNGVLDAFLQQPAPWE